jgi:hypothetical protein
MEPLRRGDRFEQVEGVMRVVNNFKEAAKPEF